MTFVEDIMGTPFQLAAIVKIHGIIFPDRILGVVTAAGRLASVVPTNIGR